MLIHLQICEALQKTVGQDYLRKLHDYEVSKTEEIDKYLTTQCSTKCVKLMTEKLKTFMKFISKHNQGTVSFTYGEDINKNMSPEECEFMNQSYEIGIELKAKHILNHESAYRDAFEQVTMDVET